MGEWQEVTLGEIYEFASGLSKPRSEFGSGYPFLSFKDVFYNIFVPEKLNSLVRSDDKERERCSIRRGDVFLTRTSETMDELGMSCVALYDVPEGTFNGFTKRLRPKSSITIVPEYAGFFFRSPFFRQSVNAMATMSTRASLNNEMLARLKMILPPAAEQEAIGRTLGVLDDKIESNRRTNETLEAMARAIFKDWFVDFGPTRAKMEGREPYLAPELWALFPDRIDDETGLPEGWKTYVLDDLADHHRATLAPGDEPNRIYEHYSIPAYDAGQEPAIDKGESIKSNKTVVPEGAILLSKLNPEIERVWLPNPKGAAPQIASTEFLAFTPKPPANRGVLFCLFRSSAFRETMAAMVTGTSKSHQRVSPRALLDREVLAVHPRLLEFFDKLAESILARLLSNRSESRSLSKTRDLLLPKLMSGEIRLRDAEKIAGEAL